MNTAEATTLQSLLWPEPGLCTERDLYVHLEGPAALALSERRLEFCPGGNARFGTYCNLFNLGKWNKRCGLNDLALCLQGAGRFELTVFLALPDRSWERLVNEVIQLLPGEPLTAPVRPPDGVADRGVVFFELTALGQGQLTRADWQTTQQPLRHPDLMLSVTTFRREAAVARTVERFEAFIADSALREHIHLTVVDNGQSADLTPSDTVSVVPNENLGGSGGFARGLLAAQERGASHCLFMDDDASVHMEAIERTWMFLAYATDPATAVAGAVSNAQHRWQLWENGAIFDHICHPQHKGTDLRNLSEVLALEHDSTATRPHNFYGGWWYFAFPVDAVRHMPFPYFVRGDDVSFSLAHDFDIVTLNGVMSHQDEDFSVKETPLTVYLDLRSHLSHHLALPRMEIGRIGVVKIAARFYLRALLACHYETLEATALALEDTLAGPDYFATHADMAARRQQIGALTRSERWRPEDAAAAERGATRVRLSPHRFLPRLLSKITINGHLLPGFRLIGNRIVLPADQRGVRRPLWGAAEITYVTNDGQRSYTVRHSKAQALRVSLPVLRAIWRIWRDYDRLRDTWRTGYDSMTQRAFWRQRLTPDGGDTQAPRASVAGG